MQLASFISKETQTPEDKYALRKPVHGLLRSLFCLDFFGGSSLHSVFSKPHLATGLPLDDLQVALDEAAEAGAHFCEAPGRRHAARSWLQRNGFSPQVVELLDSMLEIRMNFGCEPFFCLEIQTTSFWK